jgi:hypothetical protein
MALIQLPLGHLSRRRGGARQEHGEADCPTARPRSQGSTKWALAAHHHGVSPIASPVAHAGTEALQQPWREQEGKSCHRGANLPERADGGTSPPLRSSRGARATTDLQGPHGALPYPTVTFGLGTRAGGRALGGLASGLSWFETSEAVASAPDSRGSGPTDGHHVIARKGEGWLEAGGGIGESRASAQERGSDLTRPCSQTNGTATSRKEEDNNIEKNMDD